MTKRPLKVYMHGYVGRDKDIEKVFKKLGVKNPMAYHFSDPATLYYVNQNNEIAITSKDTDIYYVITTSSDWTEMKLKEPKKTRRFVVTVREGSSSCDGCALVGKCTDIQKSKCELARQLNNILDGTELSGKVLEVIEVDNKSDWVKVN